MRRRRLTDFVRPFRLPLIFVFAVMLLGSGGCGDDDSSDAGSSAVPGASAPESDDTEEVVATLNEILALLGQAQQDDVEIEDNSPIGMKICELVADPNSYDASGGQTCPYFTVQRAQLQTADYSQPTVGQPNVSGDKATVPVAVPYQGDPSQPIQNKVFKLRRVEGEWKVVDPNP